MKSLCNRWVSVWNPDTLKEIVRSVHEVHPVFVVTLSTFLHMLCGWMMIPCQLLTFSEFICSAFQFQGHLAQNKSVNALKIAKISKQINLKWWRGFEWCILSTEKLWSSNKFKKKWNPFVTDEFPYETLIRRKRLSVLYTKCIQFLP